jgi:hypothetical protein
MGNFSKALFSKTPIKKLAITEDSGDPTAASSVFS